MGQNKLYEKFIQLIQKARSHEGFLRYAKNTSWLMGEKILRMFIGLFVGIWVARYLGPEQFGLLSYAQSFVFLFTAIATLGLDSIVVRELVKNGSQRDIILGTAFTLKLIGAIGILPILWIAVQFTSNDSYTNLLIFITAGATIFQSFNVIDFYYQSTVMSKYVALSNTISLLLSSFIKVILILNHASLVAFAWLGVFDAVVVMAGFLYSYITKTGHRLGHWRFDRGQAKQLLRDSYPLIISSVMISLYMRIDQVMIKEMLDTNAVGQYAAAVRLSEAWYFIPMAVCSSLFPAIVNAKQVSQELYFQRLRQLYTIMIWSAIMIAIPVTLLSPLFISLLYGEAYSQAVTILQYHIWTGIFVGLGVASSGFLNIENLNHLAMYRTGLGLLINILLNLLLIKKVGAVGAAIATFFAQVFAAYLYDLLHPSLRANFWLKTNSFFFMRS